VTLIEEITKYRLAHDLTWPRLARHLGMSVAGIFNIAKGKAKPYERTEARIRRRLVEPPADEVVSDGH